MNQEPESNIGRVCPDCAPKAGGFENVPPEKFVGIHVKKGFDCPNGITEHMWVFITKVCPDNPKALYGNLNQDPVYSELKDGDLCRVLLSEIEDVYAG